MEVKSSVFFPGRVISKNQLSFLTVLFNVVPLNLPVLQNKIKVSKIRHIRRNKS